MDYLKKRMKQFRKLTNDKEAAFRSGMIVACEYDFKTRLRIAFGIITRKWKGSPYA